MRILRFACHSLLLLLILEGCGKGGSTIARREACNLLSKEEVQSVQDAPLNETKSSEQADGVFLVSQCFYPAAEFSKSVNLALVQKDPNQRDKRSPRDFWKEKFGQYDVGDKEREEKAKTKAGEEREKETTPPKKIAGLGDDAYWVGNRFGGILYVLKGDAFISIGLGGTDEEETKLKKSKMIAQKALQRL
jgi:hypothetical protein